MDIKNYVTDFIFCGNSIKLLNIKNDFVTCPNDSKTQRKVDVSYSITQISKDEEQKHILGFLVLTTVINIMHGKSKCQIEIAIEGCFSSNDIQNDETFKKMLEINGCATLYSITRAIISSVSSQVFNNGNVMLPMVNVHRMQNDNKSKEQ